MPRSIWSGTISFGLVSIPVKLFTATASKTVHFHQLEEGTGERIERKRVSAGSGEEVDYDDIVKGYDLGDGRHVIVEPDELDSVDPGQQERIEIEDFVALADVDPIFFQKTYYVAPADEASAKSYELLRATMHDTERVAIARFVMRTKQYLATVRPASNILMLQTMFFSDEVRDPSAIEEMAPLDGDLEPTKRELSTAAQLVESLTADWNPDGYDDTYRQRILDLVERKAAGDEIVDDDDSGDGDTADVIDLMAALEASVERVRGERRDSSGDADPADLGGLTRDQLYERAREHDIAGRSKMSKDDLIHAIEHAS